MTTEGPARRTRTGRAFVALGVLTGLAALGVFGYAAWEIWGTNAHEADAQAELQAAYDAAVPEPAPTSTVTNAPESAASTDEEEQVDEQVVVEEEPVALLPGGVEERLMAVRFPADSPALAVIEVPTIGLTKIVMRDVSVDALREGPGHYRGTARPGFEGNAAIAGHRTTYGAPFGRVDELQPGDEIVVSSRNGRFTYVVMDPSEAFAGYETDIKEYGDGHVIVGADATWVVRDFGDNRLTLTSCHPENSSRNRIVVTAQLVTEAAPTPEIDIFAGLDADDLEELVTEDLTGSDDEDAAD